MAELQIQVDSGRQRVPINDSNTGEEVGVFYFSPTDFGIVTRFNESMKDLDKLVAPLEKINIHADGTTDEGDEKAFEIMDMVKTDLFNLCDYIFGGNMSEAFFGKVHPFSPINGKFYCETALEAVGQFIADQFKAETTKVNRRMRRYTEKYAKGGKK